MHWGPVLVPAFRGKDSGPALGDTCSVSTRHPGQLPCGLQEGQEPNQLIQAQASAPDWFWSLHGAHQPWLLAVEVKPQPGTGAAARGAAVSGMGRWSQEGASTPLLPVTPPQTLRLPPTQHTGLPWQLQARAGSRRPLSSSSRFSSCHTPVPTLGHSRTDPAAHAPPG